MKEFEYCMDVQSLDRPDLLGRIMNNRGFQGFELVSVVKEEKSKVVYLFWKKKT